MSLSQTKEQYIQQLLELLAKQIGLKDYKNFNYLRLLRPIHTNEQERQSNEKRIKTLKLQLRNTIMNHKGSDVLNDFDKICIDFQERNIILYSSTLALLDSLAFSDSNRKPSINFLISNSDVNLPKHELIEPSRLVSMNYKTNQIPNELIISLNSQDRQKLCESNIDWIPRNTEHLILIDLLYIFQGINGKYIKYDTRNDNYHISQSLNISISVNDLILSLCELGWLYLKVSSYISKITSSSGLIVQAFVYSLQEELHDYYRLLAILEQELYRVDVHEPNDESSGLTLLRLRVWMQEPLERMCLMARLLDCSNILSGGALASKLHAHGQHGEQVVHVFINRIMDHICIPLYNMLVRWILHGELQDPHNEFFIGIQCHPNDTSTNLWNDIYVFRHINLPTFIPLSLGMRILVIGKSINFIRLCSNNLLKASQASPSPISILPKHEFRTKVDIELIEEEKDLSLWLIANLSNDVNKVLQGLRYGKELEFTEMIQKISFITDKRLLDLMIHRFYLHDHLLALKKFMLLGQVSLRS